MTDAFGDERGEVDLKPAGCFRECRGYSRAARRPGRGVDNGDRTAPRLFVQLLRLFEFVRAKDRVDDVVGQPGCGGGQYQTENSSNQILRHWRYVPSPIADSRSHNDLPADARVYHSRRTAQVEARRIERDASARNAPRVATAVAQTSATVRRPAMVRSSNGRIWSIPITGAVSALTSLQAESQSATFRSARIERSQNDATARAMAMTIGRSRTRLGRRAGRRGRGGRTDIPGQATPRERSAPIRWTISVATTSLRSR